MRALLITALSLKNIINTNSMDYLVYILESTQEVIAAKRTTYEKEPISIQAEARIILETNNPIEAIDYSVLATTRLVGFSWVNETGL
jgi:hypothetical protein